MSKKYTYSREMEFELSFGKETYSAVEFDTFDEAKNAVEKGIRDRRIELSNARTLPAVNNSSSAGVPKPAFGQSGAGGSGGTTSAPSGTTPTNTTQK